MEQQYLDLLKNVLENGDRRQDRTGTGTQSLFAQQLRCDLSQGFPLLTTKKVAWNSVVGELLWFIEGSGDERRLAEITHGSQTDKTTIWTANAEAPYWQPKAKFQGDLGRVYGVQWRGWRQYRLKEATDHLSHPDGGTTYFGAKVTVNEIDQLAQLIHTIKTNPTDRRMLLTAFNVGELDQMALPPCHMMAQFWVSSDGRLSCHMTQRSADLGLGTPFNIASYALLTHMIAHVTDLGVGELIISNGDAHIYLDHESALREQINRQPLALPQLWLNPDIRNIDDFTVNDIKIQNYSHHGPLKMKMAV